MLLTILFCLVSPLLSSVPCGTHLPKAHESNRFKRMIIGGNNVNAVGKWPWQVLVFTQKLKGEVASCGGTVISEKWILTAGHCVRTKAEEGKIFDVQNFEVLGAVTFGIGNKNVKIINVTKSIPFANYTPYSHGDDIALLKLEEPIIFDHSISPICLPKFTQSIPTDGYAVAIGFGSANIRGTNATVFDTQLREVIVPIVQRDICNLRWARTREGANSTSEAEAVKYMEQFRVLCAGSMGHAAYKGDSGGPLMMKAEDGRWFQIGVTSFVNYEHFIDADVAPSAFTDVRVYCEWIKETTGGEASCQEKEVTLEDVEIHV